MHTRIDETIAQVRRRSAHAGNVYVNRNMVGAVVGVQPFGGEGLSGTGPKAGGPLYLYRLLARRPDDVMARAVQEAPAAAAPPLRPVLQSLAQWAQRQPGRAALANACARFGPLSRAGASEVLPGPTGERNVYSLMPRNAVLCLAAADDDLLVQLAAVLAVGTRAIWPATAQPLLNSLPAEVQSSIALVNEWRAPEVLFDVVLFHGADAELESLRRELAAAARPHRDGGAPAPRRGGPAAGTPGGRARGQHQHRRRRRQRLLDGNRLSSWRGFIEYFCRMRFSSSGGSLCAFTTETSR